MEFIENAVAMIESLKWWIGAIILAVVGTAFYEKKFSQN